LLTDAYDSEDGLFLTGLDSEQIEQIVIFFIYASGGRYSIYQTEINIADPIKPQIIDRSLSISDPRIGFFLADLPASLSIVWVAVQISDVSIRIFFFSPVKNRNKPNSIDTRELVLGAWPI